MELQFIELTDLKTASVNVRKIGAREAEDSFAAERQAVRELLGFEDHKHDTLVPRKEDWSYHHDLKKILAALIKLDDATIMRILTIVIAETLPSGSALVEVLGNMLTVNMADHWQPEDTFLDLLRDKQATNAMLEHIGGKVVATGNITATAKVQKQIIKDFLNGTRQPEKKDWQPRYMHFPMQAYTDKGGIEAMTQWEKIKKHFTI